MLTPAQIVAFISVLMAFGVDPTTISNVQGILSPKSPPVQTVPVVQTPIQENAPVYFGSVAPTQDQPVQEPAPCDDTPIVSVIPFTAVTSKHTLLDTPVVLKASGNDYDAAHDVWLGVGVTSACGDSWTVSSSGRNVSPQKNAPADNYPVGTDAFYGAALININANQPGDYLARLDITNGMISTTTTFEVVTNP